MTKITREEIFAKSTANKGWTKGQFAAWGIAWPPAKGWIERLTGDAHQCEPMSCGEHCPAGDITNAAIRAIMKAASVDEGRATELLAEEFAPNRQLP